MAQEFAESKHWHGLARSWRAASRIFRARFRQPKMREQEIDRTRSNVVVRVYLSASTITPAPTMRMPTISWVEGRSPRKTKAKTTTSNTGSACRRAQPWTLPRPSARGSSRSTKRLSPGRRARGRSTSSPTAPMDSSLVCGVHEGTQHAEDDHGADERGHVAVHTTQANLGKDGGQRREPDSNAQMNQPDPAAEVVMSWPRSGFAPA